MRTLKVEVSVSLELLIPDSIDPEWAANECIYWKKSWGIIDQPGIATELSCCSSVNSFKLIRNQPG